MISFSLPDSEETYSMQLLEFMTNHWPLVTAFIALLLLFIVSELRNKKASAARVSPQQATQLINKEEALVIDLRDETAYQKGHIISAKQVLPSDVLTSKHLSNKEKVILLTCQNGFQSPGLGQQLRKQGFTRVYFLAGGIDNWLNSGLLLVKGNK